MAKTKKRRNKGQNDRTTAGQSSAEADSSAHAGDSCATNTPNSNRAAAKSAGRASTRLGPSAIALLALCGAGIALTLYLSYVAMFGDHPAYCSANSDCDLVQSSRWSTLLGLPMAVWGLLTYVALGTFCWLSLKKPSRWRTAFLIAVVGVSISTYLTFISVTEIQATCAYCLASYGIITAILVLLAVRKPDKPAVPEWRRVLPSPLILAAMTVAALGFHYGGVFDPAAGPERPGLRSLALHLQESGAKFYGASWCQVCQQQKALFEASAKHLPYVECSPQGRRRSQSAACAVQQVNEYPTWIIQGRRYNGLQSIEALQRYSRFKPPTKKANTNE